MPRQARAESSPLSIPWPTSCDGTSSRGLVSDSDWTLCSHRQPCWTLICPCSCSSAVHLSAACIGELPAEAQHLPPLPAPKLQPHLATSSVREGNLCEQLWQASGPVCARSARFGEELCRGGVMLGANHAELIEWSENSTAIMIVAGNFGSARAGGLLLGSTLFGKP